MAVVFWGLHLRILWITSYAINRLNCSISSWTSLLFIFCFLMQYEKKYCSALRFVLKTYLIVSLNARSSIVFLYHSFGKVPSYKMNSSTIYETQLSLRRDLCLYCRLAVGCDLGTKCYGVPSDLRIWLPVLLQFELRLFSSCRSCPRVVHSSHCAI